VGTNAKKEELLIYQRGSSTLDTSTTKGIKILAKMA
jgi:hypothetical protein